MNLRQQTVSGQTEQPIDLKAEPDRTKSTAILSSPIRMLAVDAAIYTFAIDAGTERELVAHLEEAVAAALVAAYAPIAEIARQTTRVADSARAVACGDGSDGSGDGDSGRGRRRALQARGNASAVDVAKAATDAADRVAAAVPRRDEGAAATAAAQIATAVHDAAEAKAREYTRAAALVAQAAADAVAKVTHTADTESVATELKVFETAAAVRAIALDACYQVALDAAASAAEHELTKKSIGQAL